MKNEVKKKMHVVLRAMLNQSHCETIVKKKISTPLHQNQSPISNRKA